MEILKSVFRLTKKIYLTDDFINGTKLTEDDFSNILEETLHYGFVISPSILKKSAREEVEVLVKTLKTFFVSETSWNHAFYQNWQKIKNLSDFEIFFNQTLHYLTVYLNDLNFIEEDYIYLPKREFNLDRENLVLDKVFVVNEISKEEILKKITDMVSTGFALSEEMVVNSFNVIKELNLDLKEILKKSKNREFSCKLMADLKIVPKDPEDFIRQVVYACTDSTLVIKNKETLEAIKTNYKKAEYLFYEYERLFGLKDLSSIFLRHKPIFLMMKGDSAKLSSIINKIGRNAKFYHKPVVPSTLDTVVQNIDKYSFSDVVFAIEVKGKSPLRLVALYNHLLTISEENRVYRIRNGKLWAEKVQRDFLRFETKHRNLKSALQSLRGEIVRSISENLKGKKIYLPNNVDFAVPTSGKNFVGAVPEGTCIRLDRGKTTLFGVHWNNVNYKRVDLDLSCANNEKKIGWDEWYRDVNTDIWFSGDMTSAPEPRGASEFFNFGSSNDEYFYSVFLNDYTQVDKDVEYTFILGQPDEEINDRDELFKLKDKLFSFKDTIYREKMLGLLENTKGSKKFYFGGGITGNKRTVRKNEVKQILHDASIFRLRNRLSLNSVLLDCDVTFVSSKEEADISFDLDSLTPDLFLNIFNKRR